MPLKQGQTFEEKQAEIDKRKPPCSWEQWDDRRQRTIYIKPAVTCAFECEKCGWNPVVKKRRVQKMLAEYEANRAKERKAKREAAKKGGRT